jgi:hypothetical protein
LGIDSGRDCSMPLLVRKLGGRGLFHPPRQGQGNKRLYGGGQQSPVMMGATKDIA